MRSVVRIRFSIQARVMFGGGCAPFYPFCFLSLFFHLLFLVLLSAFLSLVLLFGSMCREAFPRLLLLFAMSFFVLATYADFCCSIRLTPLVFALKCDFVLKLQRLYYSMGDKGKKSSLELSELDRKDTSISQKSDKSDVNLIQSQSSRCGRWCSAVSQRFLQVHQFFHARMVFSLHLIMLCPFLRVFA